MKYVQLCNTEIYAGRKQELLKSVSRRLEENKQSVIFTPNFQMLRAALKDGSAQELLAEADFCIPDGVGVCALSLLRKGKKLSRLTGIDTAYDIMRLCAERGFKIYLLGGKHEVAKRAKARLQKQIRDLRICGTHHGYFNAEQSSAENAEVLENIRRARPDVLFVCMGFPRQERWIRDNAPDLPDVKLFMGLGGSLDVWSGEVRRAPVPIQKCGLEWLWRCGREPRRFLRLLGYEKN